MSEAGGRIQPSTGELLPALKQRLSDSNRNLAARVMNILASMCRAMGPAFERQGRILVEPVVKNLGDNKKPVRALRQALGPCPTQSHLVFSVLPLPVTPLRPAQPVTKKTDAERWADDPPNAPLRDAQRSGTQHWSY